MKARRTDRVYHEQEMTANRQVMKIRQNDPDNCAREGTIQKEARKIK